MSDLEPLARSVKRSRTAGNRALTPALWGRDGDIVLLEVVDYRPETSRRFPQISNLRNLPGRGQELL